MDADDPRHGTYAGAVQHYFEKSDTCRPCKDGAADYRRGQRARRYLARGPLEVPATGTLRRVYALCALGYHMREIDEALDRSWGFVSQLKRYPLVHRTTAVAVAEIYDRWSGSAPEPTPLRTRQRKIAAARGWAPPLAWDDIDDPDEKPQGVGYVSRRLNDVRIADEYDDAVVERVLGGEYTVPATVAERRAIVARWPESLAELERNTGWKTERYSERESA